MNFTNDTIDTHTLPRFEKVDFTPLHRSYLKVILTGCAIVILIVSALLVASFQGLEIFGAEDWPIAVGIVFIMIVYLILSIISFRKKAYAFREHDVLFRSGIISTNITIIPYNRVQHVALHEGLVPRYFDLAEIRIYTAGSDIAIPGILKSEADGIKQLLTGKIKKELYD